LKDPERKIIKQRRPIVVPYHPLFAVKEIKEIKE
jgi:hypothetical protein